ncbi:hypothetical protein I2486_17650 [Cellulophaga sp. E16_2]|uniref:leucine-rich repeat domain-containing protein n=1 Tax=Cellulophaga sp. E16_2 TaxID=2789297 RepID=UPI001A931E45|nr:hypothetical protein [Cellulophaga sp. E16_2]MBO0593232.1 hypothetical protein [Cellulophaga sp. E16_2]
MNTRFLLIFFLFFINIAFSQPGYSTVEKNINHFSAKEIQNCKNTPNFYRCSFIIDSTSHLEKIKNLSTFKSLSLIIDLPKLPKEFSNIKFDSLSTLNIYADSLLQNLSGLPNLSQLKNLRLNFSGQKLPKEFVLLTSLKAIRIVAPNLENINVLSASTTLESLYVKSNSLKTLPVFKAHNRINDFTISVASNFKDYTKISALKKLERLTIVGGSMRVFPDNFSKKLNSLNLTSLPYLKDVSGIANYQNLTTVFIKGTGLRNLKGDFSKLLKLQNFSFSYNDSLNAIDGINTFNTLDHIEIIGLPALTDINLDMSSCNFKTIRLEELKNLQSITGIATCKSLESLTIGLTKLKNLPKNFSDLENLNELNFSHSEIADISEIKDMKSLRSVRFYECNQLREIPLSFSSNLALTDIHLEFMTRLKFLYGLGGLKKLKTLKIRAVNNQFTFPENLEASNNIETISIESTTNSIRFIKNLKHLRQLKVSMYTLSEIPSSLYSNSNLEVFEFYVSSVTDLSSLVQFTKLKEVYIKHNPYLIKIPDLTNLDALIKVDIRYNDRLKILKSSTYMPDWQIENNGTAYE